MQKVCTREGRALEAVQKVCTHEGMALEADRMTA